MKQYKLSRGPLLNKKGHLIEKGYSKHFVKVYDRNRIKSSRLKLKEWDYYLIYNDQFSIALTVADNGYVGLGSISLMDFTDRTYKTSSRLMMLPLGKLRMPTSSSFGPVSYKHKNVTIDFKHTPNGRLLTFNMEAFKGSQPLKGEILLYDVPKESMVITVPFPKHKRQFFYNHKIVGMKAKGQLVLGDQTFDFTPEETTAIFDWGRGVWPYKNTWYWSSASGTKDGHKIGFNLGYGFGDTRNATENMLFYDNKGHKISHVYFDVPRDATGKADYMATWTFTSSDQRFSAQFSPCLDRQDKASLAFMSSNQHQVFGYFTGHMILDSGKRVEFKDLMGFAEQVTNKW